jgi:hypothetical protein
MRPLAYEKSPPPSQRDRGSQLYFSDREMKRKSSGMGPSRQKLSCGSEVCREGKKLKVIFLFRCCLPGGHQISRTVKNRTDICSHVYVLSGFTLGGGKEQRTWD